MIFYMNKSAILPLDRVILFLAIFVIFTAVLLLLFFILKKKLQKKRLKIFAVWVIVWILAGGVFYSTGYFGEFINVDAAKSRNYSKINN